MPTDLPLTAPTAPAVSTTLTTPTAPAVLRYAAFPDPVAALEGASVGNPAGVVLGAAGLDDRAMQAIADEVGYAETAFVVGSNVVGDARRQQVRFFSPIAEVPFCGHATVATAVALSERTGVGRYTFDTAVGEVVIETSLAEGAITAAFTSVAPEVRPIGETALQTLLALLGLTEADLDDRYPVRVAYAGNWHPIVVLHNRAAFDEFRFDPAQMRALMDAEGWKGTVTVLFAASPHNFEARNLFPVGAITEDPATGSAAASLGGYLRAINLVDVPTRVIVHQGHHVGRPSLLSVDIPLIGGIVVSGTAVSID